MSDLRATLDELIRKNGDDYSGMSRLLGRNAAYIQQFIKRGSPRMLSEGDRNILARYFGVEESLLGGPARRGGPVVELVQIPVLDVSASAGHGALGQSRSWEG